MDSDTQQTVEPSTSETTSVVETSETKMETVVILDKTSDVIDVNMSEEKEEGELEESVVVTDYTDEDDIIGKSSELGKIIAKKLKDRKKRICHCYPLRKENRKNQKRNKSRSLKAERHIHYELTNFMSEFLVGNKLHVKVVLHIDTTLEPSERVLIVLVTPEQQVSFPYLSYFTNAVTAITEGMLGATEHTKGIEKVDFAGVQNLSVEFYKDEHSSWVVLRQYVNGEVWDTVHISSTTWVELMHLTPTLHGVSNHYVNVLLEDKAKIGRHNVTTFNRHFVENFYR